MKGRFKCLHADANFQGDKLRELIDLSHAVPYFNENSPDISNAFSKRHLQVQLRLR
jgi:hypothetical protein